MEKHQEKKTATQKGKLYFNFNKFEKLLDRLMDKGVDITTEDFEIKNLRGYKEFKYFFDKFSQQEIKSYLLFYQQQIKDL